MSPDFNQEDKLKREQILTLLPLSVTTITLQKNNEEQFSLFNQKTFLIGVSSKTLLDYSIQKGTILTHDLFHKISAAEEYQSVKERGYRLLAGRDHGCEELKRKLVKKGFSSEITEKVVVELRQKDLLNDHEFAKKFTRDMHLLKKWGPRKIESALLNKGIPRHVVSEVIKELMENLNPVDSCINLVTKRKKHFLRETDLYKRKQKIFRYLIGKGYTPEKIKNALPIIAEQLDA